ncbi:MAG: enoyl-CoA hydratase/isomerase family protein, partial [Gemmataceae bacterium]
MEEVSIAHDDGVARVSLSRPKVRNAVTLAMWRELAAIFARFATDRNVRAVI